MTKRLFQEESDEIKEKVAVLRDAMYAEVEEPAAKTPEAYQRYLQHCSVISTVSNHSSSSALDSLPRLQPSIDRIAGDTGCTAVLLLGGRSHDRGGKLCVHVLHSGTTPSGNSFPKASERYNDFVGIYHDFLNLAFRKLHLFCERLEHYLKFVYTEAEAPKDNSVIDVTSLADDADGLPDSATSSALPQPLSTTDVLTDPLSHHGASQVAPLVPSLLPPNLQQAPLLPSLLPPSLQQAPPLPSLLPLTLQLAPATASISDPVDTFDPFATFPGYDDFAFEVPNFFNPPPAVSPSLTNVLDFFEQAAAPSVVPAMTPQPDNTTAGSAVGYAQAQAPPRAVLGNIDMNVSRAASMKPPSQTRLPSPPRQSPTDGIETSKFQPWLVKALAYLTSLELGDIWINVLHLFLKVEEKLGFPSPSSNVRVLFFFFIIYC